MEKLSYISAPEGELDISVVRTQRPEVSISLDLGIPNFTVFALKFPCVDDKPQGMQELVAEGVRALLDEVASFMLSLNFNQDVIVQLYAAALHCFQNMTDESDTMAQFSEVSMDPSVKTYAGTFKLPIDFINQTQEKVVTGGSGKIFNRMPKIRHLELTQVMPNKNNLGDAARVIRHYRNRTLNHQPRPLYVVVYDQMGRATGTLPLGNNFRNKLLQSLKSSRSVNFPDFTEAVTISDDIELKLKNVPGIPKNITIGSDMYFPEGWVGDDMALYLCQTQEAKASTWVVKLSDGRIVRFVDRPSLQALRSENYPVPARYYHWNLIRDERTPLSNEVTEVVNAGHTSGTGDTA